MWSLFCFYQLVVVDHSLYLCFPVSHNQMEIVSLQWFYSLYDYIEQCVIVIGFFYIFCCITDSLCYLHICEEDIDKHLLVVLLQSTIYYWETVSIQLSIDQNLIYRLRYPKNSIGKVCNIFTAKINIDPIVQVRYKYHTAIKSTPVNHYLKSHRV